LSLNPQFNEENEGIVNWPRFLRSQIDRIIQWSFPVKNVSFGAWGNDFLLAGMFLIIGIFVWKQVPENRILYLIIVLSGVFWLFPLRNLSAFHDYTAMYYIGIPLVFYLAIFSLLRPPQLAYVLLVIGLVVYSSAIVQLKSWHEQRAGDASAYTYDFMQILQKIDGTGNKVNVAEVILYGPFPPGFYLSQQYLSYKDTADYVISRNKKYLPNNLTPDNKVIFLFKP
jgi:hypothetical protein